MKFKARKRAGIIYSVKNEITGEFYIGATTDSVEKRKKDHEQKTKTDHRFEFQEAISTYGADVFSWTQIDTANSIDELAKKEKLYILEYNSKENGYNCDSGGGFRKTVYQYSLKDGSLVDIFDSLKSASIAINSNRKQISRACLNVNKTYGGFYWSYEYKEPFSPEIDCRMKEVFQIDFDGNLIDIYASVAEASDKTGVNKSGIAKVCRGEQKTAGGFLWQY